ncbi:Ahc1p KNAG_0B03270 [Huiozyma naganishii CBS 8797]|uniref:Protein AHC1 n=1 Tax=Huiozyma naganishii (strain ATCC MYA-139 / BCRC 22969 / CBS 8797 / KCTC 17520 / NBRC 10181 / NCYC 3082 / Yp74L-3) TaxID=1071383 RepID=J7RGV3_HUIN7|nr:hypothetical protein KNAG_0B03270 [Kazachstania naganishii CBS 8797]CCK68768.1 hypothetical protein KNAG_0B03270 [Kazachstania naganishii CBS 8797]
MPAVFPFLPMDMTDCSIVATTGSSSSGCMREEVIAEARLMPDIESVRGGSQRTGVRSFGMAFPNGNEPDVTSSQSSNLPRTYQVATPKSPHELSDEDYNDNGMLHTNTDVISMSNIHEGSGTQRFGGSFRESEDVERLKYETAKNELLDKLNLRILINHRERGSLEREIKRVDAQLSLIETLHDDSELMTKISSYRIRELESTRKRRLQEEHRRNVSFNEQSLISTSSSAPEHHYHTRSKSQGNIMDNATMSQMMESPILNSRTMRSKDSSGRISPHKAPSASGKHIQEFKPNQMNSHHRRTYVSSCLTNNSGVVGKTTANEPIFRRFDGILVIITCATCGRNDFTSAQGITNHTRLKHQITYRNQPLAILKNQQLLSAEQQDPAVLQKFKDLNLDPGHEYLPYDVALPPVKNHKSEGLRYLRKSSAVNINAEVNAQKATDKKPQGTSHLEKLYKKDDFGELLEMVHDAKKDLDVVLQQESEAEVSEGSEESGEFEATISKQKDQFNDTNYSGKDVDSDYQTSSSSSPGTSPESVAVDTTSTHASPSSYSEGHSSSPVVIQPVGTRMNLRRRKTEEKDQEEPPIKRRLRSPPKNPTAATNEKDEEPGQEPRSKYYNLRAKSKLRGGSDVDLA